MNFDVIVVGAGMLGIAHAWAAAKRGLSVAVIERSRQAHGATIRNFGQVIVTGQAPGMMLSHAQQARELWLDLAAKAGFHVRANGALVLARNTDEADVLQEFADTRLRQEGYRAELLSGREVAALYDGRLAHHCAARGLDDLQIYSREALPAITRYLAESLGVTFITGTLARAVEQGRVATTAGEFRGDHVFVCPGHDYLTLLPERFAPLNLEVTRLQMLRAAFESAPFALDRPLLTGLSCVHYGAFSDLPSALALREVIQARTPMLLDNGIHLLVSPTPYGELIIGDSHQYGQDAPRSTTRRSTTPCWTWPRRRWRAAARGRALAGRVWRARPGAVLGHVGGRRDHGRRDAFGRGHDGGPGDRRARGSWRHRTLKPARAVNGL